MSLNQEDLEANFYFQFDVGMGVRRGEGTAQCNSPLLPTQSVVPGAYWNCRLLGSITDLLDNLSLYLNISQVMYRYSKGQETPVYKSPGRSLKPQLKGRDERAVHSQQHTWHKQTQVQD